MIETQPGTGIGLITVVEAGRTLALATGELRTKPSRERLKEFEKARWDFNRFAMGLSSRDVAVSDCPVTWSDSEIRKFSRSNLGLFLPEVVSTAPEGLSLQAKAYPAMRWNEQSVPGFVRNVDDRDNVINLSGWLRTEKSIDAPNTETDEAKAREIIARNNRLGQTLNVYGEAGQVSKLLSGQYLDEVSTWVRVLSSRASGRVVYANFNPDGYCYVNWSLKPLDVRGYLGVRSVGV